MINISFKSKFNKSYNKVSINKRSIIFKDKKRIYIFKKEESKEDNINFSNNFNIRTKDSF